ncbi:MAG TPA: TonB family protein, partial [Vicinamibacteria bacterium]
GTLSWLLASGSFEPARLQSGNVFIQPPTALGGGEVLLELEVSSSGDVTGVAVLRTTPPFGDLLRQAASSFRFTPAREVKERAEPPVAVDSRVLVAGYFRPPTFYDAPARGEVPQDVKPPSTDVPFPTTMVAPIYPPTVYFHMAQMAIIEVDVSADGKVTSSKVIRKAESEDLNAAAAAAAKQWRFQPARRDGRAVASVACIVFGFRELVTS